MDDQSPPPPPPAIVGPRPGEHRKSGLRGAPCSFSQKLGSAGRGKNGSTAYGAPSETELFATSKFWQVRIGNNCTKLFYSGHFGNVRPFLFLTVSDCFLCVFGNFWATFGHILLSFSFHFWSLLAIFLAFPPTFGQLWLFLIISLFPSVSDTFELIPQSSQAFLATMDHCRCYR